MQLYKYTWFNRENHLHKSNNESVHVLTGTSHFVEAAKVSLNGSMRQVSDVKNVNLMMASDNLY